jgi:4a-hydroxytetrahydrobiopterin dehydratase
MKCIPCQGGVPPLKGKELKNLLNKLNSENKGWDVFEEHHLEKMFKFDNFKDALDFTNKVGVLAEKIQHHPDIYLSWGKVKLTLWTHKIDGLAEADFIFAAKVDKL